MRAMLRTHLLLAAGGARIAQLTNIADWAKRTTGELHNRSVCSTANGALGPLFQPPHPGRAIGRKAQAACRELLNPLAHTDV